MKDVWKCMGVGAALAACIPVLAVIGWIAGFVIFLLVIAGLSVMF